MQRSLRNNQRHGSSRWGSWIAFRGGQNYRPILIGELVARTHPTFPLEELQLIADWAMWLFINDDLFDKLTIPILPEFWQYRHVFRLH
ncbi:hypothetical protein KFU94_61565 [Chloroflexi bacterium TSY]|nr:hypothetical protein [Chloroflexi bacterium TSY]